MMMYGEDTDKTGWPYTTENDWTRIENDVLNINL